MDDWLLENLVGILSILVGGFIAYHVYFLSQKFKLSEYLTRRDETRERLMVLLDSIGDGRNSDIEIINVNRYKKDYPHNNKFTKKGHTYLKAELKALRFDGVEFFESMPVKAARKDDGTIIFLKEPSCAKNTFNIWPVGIIPYEWIDYVDVDGDELSYRPQIFVRFKGIRKSPYRYLRYYEKSDNYHKGSDPMDWQWRIVKIAERGARA